MADKAAIMRALSGGGQGGGMGGMPEGMEGQEPPQGSPKPEGGDPAGGIDKDAILAGMKAVGMLIQSEMQNGNPAARKGADQLKGLLQTLAEMQGGGALQGGQPPEEMPEDPTDPRMKMGPGTGPEPVRSFSKGKPAGTFQAARVI